MMEKHLNHGSQRWVRNYKWPLHCGVRSETMLQVASVLIAFILLRASFTSFSGILFMSRSLPVPISEEKVGQRTKKSQFHFFIVWYSIKNISLKFQKFEVDLDFVILISCNHPNLFTFTASLLLFSPSVKYKVGVSRCISYKPCQLNSAVVI